jgi:DNA-binding CsgD family transcriptional regulator
MSPLTAREREVLALTGRGLSSAEIAAALGVSELTVRKQRSSIIQKLSLRSTAALIAFALDAPGPAERPEPPPAWQTLRPREAEIVRHVASGLTSKEIARLLAISPLTVRKHRERARQKLGIHCLSEMVRHGRSVENAPAADDLAIRTQCHGTSR